MTLGPSCKINNFFRSELFSWCTCYVNYNFNGQQSVHKFMPKRGARQKGPTAVVGTYSQNWVSN